MSVQTPQSLSIEDLYNLLMYDVEQDLLSYNLEKLDTWYKDESAEDRSMRMQRYGMALALFAEKFSRFKSALKSELKEFQSTLLDRYKDNLNVSEADTVKDIEDSIQNA